MPESTPKPEITVLITAHDEAEHIQGCLQSIMAQDYPMERVEILLVDDRSSDGTAERAREMGLDCLRLATIEERPVKLTARQAALDRGLSEALGEIVLITEADGRVPRDWIRELSGHMGFRDGAATGPVIFAGGRRLFTTLQTLSSALNYAYYRWAQRSQMTTGLLGANVAVRREAYLETGGFPAIGFAADEDVALARALGDAGWSIRHLNEPPMLNPTCSGLGELIGRARRKMRSAPPMLTLFALTLILSNLLLAGLAVMFGGIWIWMLALRYLLGLMGINLAAAQYASLNLKFEALLFEPVMTLLGLWVFTLNLFWPRWTWAGIAYDRKGPIPEPTEAPSRA